MEDLIGILSVLLFVAVVVWGCYSIGKDNGLREQRLLVCEAVGYDGYSQSSCVQTESEDVRVYVSYELVLERLSSNE